MTGIDPEAYALFVQAWIGLAGAVFATLLFVDAPYGRHARPGWGPAIPARLAWAAMESPALLLVGLALAVGPRPLDARSGVAGALFLAHYAHRAVVFPLRLPRGSRPMPLAVAASAFGFQVVNGSLLGLWLGALAPAAPLRLADARTLLGLALFALGAAINLHSDGILRRLRRSGAGGYRIPTGGLFRFVSCPNYLGEIVEWAGFALVLQALPGTAFLLWTMANLVPRAIRHHRWYRAAFPDYPPKRRALVPFLL